MEGYRWKAAARAATAAQSVQTSPPPDRATPASSTLCNDSATRAGWTGTAINRAGGVEEGLFSFKLCVFIWIFSQMECNCSTNLIALSTESKLLLSFVPFSLLTNSSSFTIL